MNPKDKLLLETVTPLALEVALAVQEEMESRWLEADRLRRAQVDRARYEAHLAQRRYLQVDHTVEGGRAPRLGQ